MDELYGNETTSSSEELEVRYEKELVDAKSEDKDPDRKHFRHFDYGIDTQDNVIIIEGEIQSGMTFDVISKSRLLTKLNGGDVKTFNILLNTPGGDVIETLGLIDFMKSQEKQINRELKHYGDAIDKKNADLWLEILNFIEIKKAAQPRPISQNLFGIKK